MKAASDKTLLADAVAELIEALHQKYPGIKTKPPPPIEDEDFTIEVEVPSQLSLEEVESECHKECIRLEDKYDIYILPLVKQKAA
jgi:hypothetical protein